MLYKIRHGNKELQLYRDIFARPHAHIHINTHVVGASIQLFTLKRETHAKISG